MSSILLLLLLTCQLHSAFLQCMNCKEVHGSGPLAGSYQLVSQAEPACSNGCAYSSESGERFCFETLGEDIYQSRSCSCSPCGDRCMEAGEASLYHECGTTCQMISEPCNGTCSDGSFLCGEVCTASAEQHEYQDCEGMCKSRSLPCGGECSEDRRLCQNSTVCLQPDQVQECGDDCQGPELPCDGLCPEGRMLCGGECVRQDHSGFMLCNGQCQNSSLSCDGHCDSGSLLCDGSCVADTGHLWKCGSSCQSLSSKCQDFCPPGLLTNTTSQECRQPWSHCRDPTLQCSSDQDCQEGAGCFLSGDSMVCQCYLDSLPTTASDQACPKTGSCRPSKGVAQADCVGTGAGGPPCYGQGGTRVCPYCSASHRNIQYQYVNGTGMGKNTYNGSVVSPMVFLQDDTGCSLTVTWTCWLQAPTFAAVVVNTNSSSSCDLQVTMASSLACLATMPIPTDNTILA